MGKLSRKWKRKSNYTKSLILSTILFLLLGCIFLGYVYNSMIIYERNLVDNYIKYLENLLKILMIIYLKSLNMKKEMLK